MLDNTFNKNDLTEINISELTDEELTKIIDDLYKMKVNEYLPEKLEYILGDIVTKIIAVSFELFMMREIPKLILSNERFAYFLIILSAIGMYEIVSTNKHYVNLLKELKEQIASIEKDDVKSLTKKIDSITVDNNSKDMYINIK